MEVPLTADQVSRLAEVAEAKGRTVDGLAQDILARYLEDDARFIEAVNIGEAQLERGEYFTHEQVGERLQRLLKP